MGRKNRTTAPISPDQTGEPSPSSGFRSRQPRVEQKSRGGRLYSKAWQLATACSIIWPVRRYAAPLARRRSANVKEV